MSGMTLVKRIRLFVSRSETGKTDETLEAILADVRDLESAAKFAHDQLTRDLHDVRDGNNGCRLCEAQGKLTAILTKCSGTKVAT
jgi:hypothetical protein